MSSKEELKRSRQGGEKLVKESKEAVDLSELEPLKEECEKQLSEAWYKEDPNFQQRDRWYIEKSYIQKALRIVNKKIFLIQQKRQKKDKIIIILVAGLLAGIFGVSSAIITKILENNFSIGIMLALTIITILLATVLISLNSLFEEQ